MKLSHLLSPILIFLLASCTSADEPELPSSMPLIVEGWIEQGEAPVVMVTHAVDMSHDIADFENCVEKWGRVSIFDGETRHVLIGRIDKAYTPKFIFTTSHLKGETGHTYRLLIETDDGNIAESTSTLPAGAKISTLSPILQSDSTFSIRAHFSGIEPDGFYRIMVKTESDSRFYGAFLATFSGVDYDDETGIEVTQSYHGSYTDQSDFSHFFNTGERVSVKILTLSEDSFRFWKIYDESTSLSQNVFFSFTENLPSTLSGALGCWGAYASHTRSIRAGSPIFIKR